MDYTAGPWEQAGREVLKYGEDWAHVAIVCNPRPKNEDPYARPEPLQISSQRHKEAFANARLISAAPEMYFALKQIIDDLPSKRDWLNPDVEKIAKEALAKAEGRA